MTTVAEVMALDAAGGIHRKLKNAAKKDSVTIPDGGYVVIRFIADNPGLFKIQPHPSSHLTRSLSHFFFSSLALMEDEKAAIAGFVCMRFL